MRLGSRALFPDLSARVYLNHAAVSSASVLVREADWRQELERLGI